MNEKPLQIADLMPADSEFSLEGQLWLNGQFSLKCMGASMFGDLFSTDFEMISDFGRGNISLLGKQPYMAFWETYRYKQGMISSALLKQPLVCLYFQLEGSARAIQSSMDLKPELCQGEANLMIIPPLKETFELQEALGGCSFFIMLSNEYLKDLSDRFPHLLEPIFSKVNRREFCMVMEQNLCITPRMRGIIQRMRQYDTAHSAGSLFMEAQILNLLFLLFTRPERPASTNGHSLPRSDLERIHRAGEILLERLEAPPTLAELSRLVGTNEFKLKRGFKEVFDSTPYAYHLRHKLELARSYILDTELTISEIAYRVGYSDPAHLTHAFRKQFKIRPSDLR